MNVTNVEVPKPQYNDAYLGYLPVDTSQALLGRRAHHRSWRIKLEHMDLGLLDFIMTGPKVPGVNKRIDVDATVGDTKITGGGSTRGMFKRIDSVSLNVEPRASQRTKSLARLAVHAAVGSGYVELDARYDGALAVPRGVSHVAWPNNDRGMPYVRDEGVAFADPHLPHPDAELYPYTYGETPPAGFLGSRLGVISMAANLADSYYDAARALSSATDGEQSPTEFADMAARSLSLEPTEFADILAVTQRESPVNAGRYILGQLAG